MGKDKEVAPPRIIAGGKGNRLRLNFAVCFGLFRSASSGEIKKGNKSLHWQERTPFANSLEKLHSLLSAHLSSNSSRLFVDSFFSFSPCLYSKEAIGICKKKPYFTSRRLLLTPLNGAGKIPAGIFLRKRIKPLIQLILDLWLFA